MRLIIIPFFLYFLIQDDPKSRLIAISLFTIAAISDFLDGYLARKLAQDSKIGRFLDPLADKFLVVTALFAFYFLDKEISIWMIIAIILRDMLITFMRYLAIRKGTELKTSRLGKTKTVFQMTAIVLIMLILFVRSYRIDVEQVFTEGHRQGKGNFQISTELLNQAIKLLPDKEVPRKEKRKIFLEPMPYFLMLLTTIITVISGLKYVINNYRVLLPPYNIFISRKKL
jgi:cardiolipin synthase